VTGSRPARWTGFFCAFLLSLPALSSANPSTELCPQTLSGAIPERSPIAQIGSEFANRATLKSGDDRETLILDELLAGNLPGFLRELTPITVRMRDTGGADRVVVFCVMPDYLAIGSDSDFLRIPMGLPTAVAIANQFGFVLPTRKMVDVVYGDAAARLEPRPMKPGAQMVSTDYYTRHNRTVDEQRLAAGAKLGQLTAGHKKDLVLTKRLRTKPGRVAIYGWHRPNGKPIQPLSTVHGAEYADYSHGIRLISQTVYVDGESMSIYDLLADPALAGALSDEGPLPRLAQLVDTLVGRSGSLLTASVWGPVKPSGDS